MTVVFIYTYQDSRKPYLRQKNSGRGVTTNYPSAFDQAAFAKLDCLKTWFPSIPTIHTNYYLIITEHLKFTTIKVQNNIVINANIIRYLWYQICPSFTVRDEKIHPWTNKERKSSFQRWSYNFIIGKLVRQASTAMTEVPRVFQETHLGKPHLFQHCYAQKNNYITPHVLLKCCWPLSFHDFGHNKSFLNLPGPHNNKQPTNLMGIYTYSLNACHISLWTKASMSSE